MHKLAMVPCYRFTDAVGGPIVVKALCMLDVSCEG